MGTVFTVKVVAEELSDEQQKQISDAITTELENVNAKMSTYLPESELSRFNRHAEATPFAVSPETLAVFVAAQRVSAASEGAFDITIGALVNAWGFGPQKRPEQEPSDADLERLRQQMGYAKIEIDEAASTLRKLEPAIACDLSAIAKGYAVDRVSEALAALGHPRHMVEVGGEVRAQGRSALGRFWRIGVERPLPSGRAVQRVVPLEDLALATSGDYRNYYEKDGVRFSHTIDPRTARPIRHKLASVTVLDEQCMLADGYATALMVLGEEEGYQLALQENLPALFLVRDGESFTEKSTPRFQSLYAEDEAEGP